ncbi:MAG: hypothetical protein O3A28_10210 [Actinomycetota bacterium]|nr:hypothetical protein [Actinomycetota bacterium]MDA3035386.1 hypothetical protein [Actinomycetota bacterium]
MSAAGLDPEHSAVESDLERHVAADEPGDRRQRRQIVRHGGRSEAEHARATRRRPPSAPSGTTTGALGGMWRARITPWGDVETDEPSGGLRYWVAADDRWHDPAVETSVRQRRVDGTPVTETRLRVPNGDVVQRIWSVPDGARLGR